MRTADGDGGWIGGTTTEHTEGSDGGENGYRLSGGRAYAVGASVEMAGWRLTLDFRGEERMAARE